MAAARNGIMDKNTALTVSHKGRNDDNQASINAEHPYSDMAGTASGVLNVVIASLALFSDGYNVQIIGYMEPLFSVLYGKTMSSSIKARLSNSFLIGQIFGMLFFGVLIDRMGRRTGVIAATSFLVLGVALAAAAHGTSELGMFRMMIVSRGIAGFGAGGEYPVCATSATEAADETVKLRKRRGLLVTLTTDFAIAIGFVSAGITALIVLACFSQQTRKGVWRVCFGIGFVLPIVICFFRIRMINSTQYRKHALKRKYSYRLVLRRYWKPMLGTSLAWFLYDFVVYPFGLFSSTIMQQHRPECRLRVINCFYIPGCLLDGLLMDRIGRKQTMTLGFLTWSLWGFILGGALHPIQTIFPLFIVMYGVFNALGEMGPGVSTFLCASESFPTPVRGHFLGPAAAVGKAGASIGTEVFKPILDSFGDVRKGQQGVFF
ncbi:major facilitator superfamily domain-containing protein [Aspergillus stella-maris]|uniref:major facilitator superfamily domain-containing protein n=1 Tax=Aspergillus stella-maris TaxID=1810926 RepID=UPI003CCD4FAA